MAVGLLKPRIYNDLWFIVCMWNRLGKIKTYIQVVVCRQIYLVMYLVDNKLITNMCISYLVKSTNGAKKLSKNDFKNLFCVCVCVCVCEKAQNSLLFGPYDFVQI